MGKILNIRVTILLGGDAVLSASSFDAILARLFFDKQKNDGTFNGDYDQELPFLDKSNGVYHASFPIFKVNAFQNFFLTKKIDLNHFASINGKINSSVQENTKGPYKAWFENFEAQIVDNVVYYVRGDIDVIHELLKGLRFLGKKASIGKGRIKKIYIDEIENDMSLVFENKPMRNLPLIEEYASLNSIATMMYPINPPYWKNYRSVPCIVRDDSMWQIK